jgi:peptidoglycan/xylan/chitin deacetylase (PgdA/CDA1 family)
MESYSNKLIVVMYHYVRDLKNSRYPNIKGLTIEQFREQIEFISNNFNVIDMERFLEAKYTNLALPDNLILLTFDDGYIDHYTNVYPILKNYNIKGFFSMPAKILAEGKMLDVNKIHFILASEEVHKIIEEIFAQLNYYRGLEYKLKSNQEIFQELAIANRFDSKEIIFIKRLLQNYLVEELRRKLVDHLFEKFVGVNESCFVQELYMSFEQIKLMKNDGMFFGIHGYDHYWLNKLDENKMKKDIDSALDFFQEIIDPNHWVMCYPYGSYDNKVIEYIKTIGCIAGFGTDVRIYDINNDNVFMIPRLDTNDLPPKSENYLKFA